MPTIEELWAERNSGKGPTGVTSAPSSSPTSIEEMWAQRSGTEAPVAKKADSPTFGRLKTAGAGLMETGANILDTTSMLLESYQKQSGFKDKEDVKTFQRWKNLRTGSEVDYNPKEMPKGFIQEGETFDDYEYVGSFQTRTLEERELPAKTKKLFGIASESVRNAVPENWSEARDVLRARSSGDLDGNFLEEALQFWDRGTIMLADNLPNIAASKANPAFGAMTMFANERNSMKETLAEVGLDKDIQEQFASTYGALSAPVEYVENLSRVTSALGLNPSKMFRSAIVKKLVNAGVNVTEELVQKLFEDLTYNEAIKVQNERHNTNLPLRDVSLWDSETALGSLSLSVVMEALGFPVAARNHMKYKKQENRIVSDLQKAKVPELAVKAVVNDIRRGEFDKAQGIIDNYGADLTASAMAEQIADPTLDKASAEYKAGAKLLGGLALKKQGIELLSELDKMEKGSVLKMATDLGYTGTDIEEGKNFIYENRSKLPGYQAKVQKELLTTIAESDTTPFQKQAYKWMAQGDVELQDVGMVRAIFTAEAKKAGYDDVDAYFEENQGTFMAPGRDAIDMYQATAHHGGRGQDGQPFQNFDLSYSGTGEGAAAFGHGVYLTERFGIAKGYARALVSSDSRTIPRRQALEKFNNLKPSDIRTELIAMTTAGQVESEGSISTTLKELIEMMPPNVVIPEVFLKSLILDNVDLTNTGDVDGTAERMSRQLATSLGFPTRRENEFVYKVTVFPGQEEHEYNLLSWYDAVPDSVRENLPDNTVPDFSMPELLDYLTRVSIEGDNLNGVARSAVFVAFKDGFSSGLSGKGMIEVAKESLYRVRGKGQQFIEDEYGPGTSRSDIEDAIDLLAEAERSTKLSDGLDGISSSGFSGMDLYHALTRRLGSKKAASDFLQENGIDGITFPAESLRTGTKTPEKGNRNFVIFDEDNIRIEEARAYEQNLEFFQTGSAPKMEKIAPGEYQIGEFSISHMGGTDWSVTSNANGVFFKSTVESFEDAKAVAREAYLHQKGRTLKSGSQAVRGKTQFQQDGKFVVDLFKSGDVVTLAHEFAHVFSPHMDQKMVDAMIDRVTSLEHNIDMLGKSKKSRDQTKVYMRGLWKSFQAMGARHPRFQNKEGKDWKYLVAIQEELASQFETYLATRTAPTAEFVPVFKGMAAKYRDYYGAIRKLPVEQQKVHHDIATLFDDMIAGEKALPRVQPRKVEVDGVIYTLHLSKPKEAIRRKIVKALNRVDADVSGLKESLLSYLQEAFTVTKTHKDGTEYTVVQIPDGFKLALERVENNKHGLALMKKIDGAMAKAELDYKKSLIKEMKDWSQEKNLKKMDKDIAAMIRGVISGLDVKRKSGKRAKEFAQLQSELKKLESGAMSEMDFAYDKDSIAKIMEVTKPSIYSLSLAQVEELYKAMKDLVRYDQVRIQQHVEKEINHLTGLVEGFKNENKKTRQWKQSYKKRTLRRQKIEQALYRVGLSKVWDKYTTGVHWSPSRELEELHPAAKEVYEKLKLGKEKAEDLIWQFRDSIGSIVAGVDLEGTSTFRGPVSSKDRVPLDLLTERNMPYKYSMTKAQLMYFYGIAKNPEGLRILLEDGFRIPPNLTSKKGEEARTLKFSSPEAMMTAFSVLTPEQRGVVDQIIEYNSSVAKPLGNETSQDLLGIDVLTQDVYLPFAREGRSRGDIAVLHQKMGGEARQKTIQEFLAGTGSFSQQYVEHSGFLHARSNGHSPMYAVDFFEIMERYYTDLSTYVGMARPLRDATAVLQTGGKGSVHEELIDMLGKKKADALADYVSYVEDPSLKSSDFDSLFIKMSSAARKAILKFKAVIGISQLVSLNNYKNYLAEDSGTTADFLKVMGTGRKIGGVSIPLTSKYSKKALGERHPILRSRTSSIPEVGLTSGESARVKLMFGGQRGIKDVVKGMLLLGDVGLGWIRNPDAFAISKGLELFELQAKRHGWSEEEMMRKFLDATYRTQPNNDPIHTSRFIGKPSKGIKRFVFGIFQSATDNIRGEKQTHTTRLLNAKFSKDKEGTKTARKRLIRTVLTNAALLSLVRVLVDRALFRRDDDDEENVAAEIAFTTASRIIGMDPLLGAGINQVLSVFTGQYAGSFQSPMLDQMNRVSTALQGLGADLAEGDEISDDLYNVLKESAALFGSGWSSILSQSEKMVEEE